MSGLKRSFSDELFLFGSHLANPLVPQNKNVENSPCLCRIFKEKLLIIFFI